MLHQFGESDVRLSSPAIIALVHNARYLEVSLYFFLLAPFPYIRFVLISYLLASTNSISCICPLETEIQG